MPQDDKPSYKMARNNSKIVVEGVDEAPKPSTFAASVPKNYATSPDVEDKRHPGVIESGMDYISSKVNPVKLSKPE